MDEGRQDHDLTGTQAAVLVALGALLWLGAALLLRELADLGAYDGIARVVLYVLIVPGSWPFVLLLCRAARLSRAQTPAGIAVALAAATLLDGVALAWAPRLYGGTVEAVAGAGATILWGAGVLLVLAFVRARGRD